MRLETYNHIILNEEEIEILKKAKKLLEEIRSNAEEKSSIDTTNVIIADDALGEILYSDRCNWTGHIIWPNGW